MTDTSKAILLIAHGSSDLTADNSCTDLFFAELPSHFPQYPVYQAYSAPITLRKIDRTAARTPVHTISEAAEQILEDGITKLHVLAVYLNPCMKYSKVLQALEPYRPRFESLTVSAPLLNAEADPAALAAVLKDIIGKNLSEEANKSCRQVILAAHTATPEIAGLWEPVLRQLRSSCPLSVSLLYRNGHPNAEDFLAGSPDRSPALIIPLMLFGGRHLSKDIAGAENSLRSRLESAGIPVSLSEKGLGEYPQIRELYYQKI